MEERHEMKIAVYIVGCHQVSPEDYQRHTKVYTFDSSVTIDTIIAETGENDVSVWNLSNVTESQHDQP